MNQSNQENINSLSETHFQVLEHSEKKRQGPVGIEATKWAAQTFGGQINFGPPLPNYKMDRGQLRRFSIDPKTPPMNAYIAIMAWGGQLINKANAKALLEQQHVVEGIVEETRKNKMSREDAYNLWKGKVKGLGPSFLTKLLAFLCPDENMTIMDQWTVKSINLLYQKEVIKLTRGRNKEGAGASPQGECTGKDYERYHKYLEQIQKKLNETTPSAEKMTLSETEECIFSTWNNGEWRKYVRDNWKPPANSKRRRESTRGLIKQNETDVAQPRSTSQVKDTSAMPSSSPSVNGWPFQIKLGKIYYTKGFINPGVGVDKHLGRHGDPIDIEFDDGTNTITSRINREANTNHTVRIYGGVELVRWFQEHFSQWDNVHARVLDKNRIRLQSEKSLISE